MGDWSSITTQATPTPSAPQMPSTLTKVTNVVILRQTVSTLRVVFDTQLQATSYDIRHRLTSTAPSGAWTTNPATTSSAVIAGLTAGTSYQIQVRAKNSSEIGDWSDAVVRITYAIPVSTDPDIDRPVVVATQGVDGTQLHIAYNTRSSTHHLAYRLASTSPSGLWTTITTVENPKTLHNLIPNTSYQIRVRQQPPGLLGEWSDVITATTSSTPPAQPQTLPQVTGLSVTQGITNTDLTVAFTTQFQASYYDIAYRLAASAPSGLWSIIPTIASPTTIGGLTPNTSYQIRVRAKNSSEIGDWSDAVVRITYAIPVSTDPDIDRPVVVATQLSLIHI